MSFEILHLLDYLNLCLEIFFLMFKDYAQRVTLLLMFVMKYLQIIYTMTQYYRIIETNVW